MSLEDISNPEDSLLSNLLRKRPTLSNYVSDAQYSEGVIYLPDRSKPKQSTSIYSHIQHALDILRYDLIPYVSKIMGIAADRGECISNVYDKDSFETIRYSKSLAIQLQKYFKTFVKHIMNIPGIKSLRGNKELRQFIDDLRTGDTSLERAFNLRKIISLWSKSILQAA